MSECCNLRTGTIIIGILGIISSIYCFYVIVVAFNEIPSNTTDEDKENVQTILKIIIGVACLNLIVSVLLIFGAVKRSRCLLLPWLIYVGFVNVVASGVSMSYVYIDKIIINCLSWILWILVLHFYRTLSLVYREGSLIESSNEQLTINEEEAILTTPQQPSYYKD